MKIPVRKRKGESGQAVLLVVLGLGIFLLGAVGLAIDGSHLYAERQMAQAAADAAAQAGIMSFFDGTNTAATFGAAAGPYASPVSYTCTTTDARTPCKYAAFDGFGGTSSDAVTLKFGDNTTTGAPAVSLSGTATDAVSWMTVTVTRHVPTTFMQLLGPSAATIGASGTAAIVNVVSPVPLVITHPTMAGALNMNGTTSITITGGPQRSVQINSNGTNPSGAAYVGPSSGSVDLSGAGPNGTGGDFGTFGGPAANPGNVSLGSTGHYLGHSSPILDPLAGVIPPSSTGMPAGVSQSCKTLGHCGGCPGGASTCTEYLPGVYSAISTPGTAMFDPGIYYINGGGFSTKNSTVGMCGTTCASDPTTKDGMLIYDTGPASGGCDATGGFTIDTNSTDVFYGAGVSAANPTAVPAAPYYGILFFEDRSACAKTHTLGKGNGCFSLVGTVYITNTLEIMKANPSQYQTVLYHGTPCTGVQNYGEVIVSQLTVEGNSGINMGLFPNGFLNVRQVALVQ